MLKMKKYLILILIVKLFSLSVFAQAPQGLNYQAVAYNASGVAVTNQLLGVRLSILDGSATGTLVYQETQNPTTDNTGLFSIVIGNGTVVSGTFSTINWGNGSKWLKTEIDITGGTNYVVMGTSQFMSVPYALYANTAGTAAVGGLGSPSFTNPDGFNGMTPVIIEDSINYTVPSGKNLYIPTSMGNLAINGDTLHTTVSSPWADSKTFVGVSENDVVWGARITRLCFLVDKVVDWKTFDLVAGPYTVPANKQFVIVNYSALVHDYLVFPVPPGCSMTIDGIPYNIGNLMNSVLDENMTISTINCTSASISMVLNGYLKDK